MFSFEGVGLVSVIHFIHSELYLTIVLLQVIPITDSMRQPHKFPAVLTGVMSLLLIVFGGAGVLSYLAFGSDIQTVVIINLDAESKMTQAVCFSFFANANHFFTHLTMQMYRFNSSTR